MKKDLKFFIVQYKVLKLYRDYMKLVYKKASPENRQELVSTIRYEFDMNKNCDRMDRIEYYVALGRQRMPQLHSMLDMGR